MRLKCTVPAWWTSLPSVPPIACWKLKVLLSVAADPAERKHRKFLQRSAIAPSKSTATPLSNLSPLKVRIPLSNLSLDQVLR